MILNNDEQVLGYDIAVSMSDHLRNQVSGGEVTHDGAGFQPKGKSVSKGCEAGRTGGWLSIYLAFDCNLSCHFCTQYRGQPGYNPHTHQNMSLERKSMWDPFDQFGPPTLEALKKYAAKSRGDIKGISFCGGEPFMTLDGVTNDNRPGMYAWLDCINEINWFEDKVPYTWVYSNGTLATEENVKKLAEKGLQEIRIDLAATNFSKKMIKRIAMIKEHIRFVGVELPVLAWQVEKFCGALKDLDAVGLDYINLHELHLTEFNWEYMLQSGKVNHKMVYSNSMDKISPDWMFHLPSHGDMYTIIRFIEDNNLNIIYNDCSSRNCRLQTIGMNYLRMKLTNENEAPVLPWKEHLQNYKQTNRIIF